MSILTEEQLLADVAAGMSGSKNMQLVAIYAQIEALGISEKMDKHLDELRETATRLAENDWLEHLAWTAARLAFSFEENGIVLSRQEALKVFSKNAVPVDTSFRKI